MLTKVGPDLISSIVPPVCRGSTRKEYTCRLPITSLDDGVMCIASRPDGLSLWASPRPLLESGYGGEPRGHKQPEYHDRTPGNWGLRGSPERGCREVSPTEQLSDTKPNRWHIGPEKKREEKKRPKHRCRQPDEKGRPVERYQPLQESPDVSSFDHPAFNSIRS